jgi:hypothetical protein
MMVVANMLVRTQGLSLVQCYQSTFKSSGTLRHSMATNRASCSLLQRRQQYSPINNNNNNNNNNMMGRRGPQQYQYSLSQSHHLFSARRLVVPSSNSILCMSSSSTSTSSSSSSSNTSPSNKSPGHPSIAIKSIRVIQEAVLEAMNELFDPAEVARGAALAKFENPKKKKKAKKQPDTEENDDIVELSEEELQAMASAAAADARPFTLSDTMVTSATKSEFGDYQVNAAMGLAKAVGMNPRECATKIVEQISPKICDFMEEPEIAGPGFINLRFKEEYLREAIKVMALDADGRLGLPTASSKQKIVVDFSSPNIAKEMHVGHLRSTIIGDTLSNLLEFQGHEIVRLNHVGDWGTQFGMLVEHLRDEYPAALSLETSQDVVLGDLVELYKAAKKRFDVDEDFKTRARECVVKLQAGNAEELAAWQALCAASRVEYQKIYDLLSIRGLEERGESFYNPYLNDVVADLEERGLAVESEGATAIFLEGVSPFAEGVCAVRLSSLQGIVTLTFF